MGRGNLTQEEIKILLKNSFVLQVDNNRIIYTNEFKEYFMKEYLSGKGPTQIFAEADFDPKILGSKRIERAAARWRESYAAGSLGKYDDGSVSRLKVMEGKKIYKHQNEYLKEIEKLKTENEQLKKEIQMFKSKDL